MTTQELKQYIDKVLGSSIRCLLPSYWWKRLFGLVVDEVDKVKNSISTLEDGYKALEESKADADAFIMLETTELDRMEYGAVYLVRGQQDSLKVNFWEYKSPRPDVLNWTIWFSNKTSLEVTSNGVAFQWEGGTPTIDLSNLNPNNLYRLDCTLVTVGASGTAIKYVKRVARIVEYGDNAKYDTFVSETSTNAVQNKAVTAELAKKQDTLVSGTSIKTINGTSLLGSGDIKVAADVTVDSSLSSTSTNPVQNKVVKEYIDTVVQKVEIDVDDSLSDTSTNPVQNKVIYYALQDKASTLSVTSLDNAKADKSDIKTLNGVSLLGGGDLQLGDGQTIVYDDTEVRTTIDDIYENIDYIYDEMGNIGDIFDEYDEKIYEAGAEASSVAYELKVTEGYSLKGSAEFKVFLDQTYPDHYSQYVITDVESGDGTDDWEIILRADSMDYTEYSIKKTDLPYSLPSAGFEIIGSYCTKNVKEFKVYHPLVYENKKLKELTTSLESRIAALEGNQTT